MKALACVISATTLIQAALADDYNWAGGTHACIVEDASGIQVRTGQAKAEIFEWGNGPASFFIKLKWCLSEDLVEAAACSQHRASFPEGDLVWTHLETPGLHSTGGIDPEWEIKSGPRMFGPFNTGFAQSIYLHEEGRFDSAVFGVMKQGETPAWFTATGKCTRMD